MIDRDLRLTNFIECVGRYCGDFRVEMIIFYIAAV